MPVVVRGVDGSSPVPIEPHRLGPDCRIDLCGLTLCDYVAILSQYSIGK